MKKIVKTNEIDNYYDIKVINRAWYMVKDAIKIIEDMNLDIDVISKALGLNILDEKFTNISCVERDFFVVSTNRDGIKLSMYTKDSDAKSYDDTSRNELVAKGIILNFFLKAFEIDDASPIDEIQIEDALNKDNMTEFCGRVEALASRLLIPKKEFSDEIGEIVYNASYNEQRGEEQLLSISLIRKLLIEKLMKKYNVTEHMANVRLLNANLGDNKYDSLVQSVISDFKRLYFDSESAKETAKTKK